ncbi:PREDICTED: uncharacterized protein LOC106107832 [Papilio polytes]|uniref:uncharacterized protein LOC106107832 n=1 Tax=Papilio polytes TaxID=76194 RepID=UPI0006767B7E|nr:PREDICTED: uncharacterized protein LOC106107832 [Papilio polytes]
MQSPNEDDVGSKMVYGAHFFYDDTLDIYNEKKQENILKKMWKFCLSCCPKRRSKKIDMKDEISSQGSYTQPPVKRLFSFAELELSKISPKMYYDANVQTGESLEIDYLETQNLVDKLVLNANKNKNNRKETDELNILKFLKESKSESIQSLSGREDCNDDKNLHFNPTIHEEKELSSTVYEPHSSKSRKHQHVKVVTRGDIHIEKVEPSLPKRLRFDEEATTIPSIHADEGILEGEEQTSNTQVILGTEKLRCSDDIEEQESGSGREFMRFWTSAKEKKSKKKKRIVLH